MIYCVYSVELAESWCAAVKFMCVCVRVVESVARDSRPQYFPLQSCCFISGREKECEAACGSDEASSKGEMKR